MKVSQFNDVITKLLSVKLVEYKTKSLDLVVCLEIYQSIFDTLVEIFQTAKVTLTNEAMNYLAQQYYDAILINDNQELDPNIFTNRAKLELIETKEIALLAVMMSGTDFAIPLIQEVKRRS